MTDRKKLKRTADRQLTKADKDDEEQEVTIGIPKASDEVLKHRRILKVARNEDGSADFTKKKPSNPFASINLKQASETTTTTAVAEVVGAGAPTEFTSSTDEKAEAAPTKPIFGASSGFSGFGNAFQGGFGSTGGFAAAAAGSSSSGGFGGGSGFGALGGGTSTAGSGFAWDDSAAKNGGDQENGETDGDEETVASTAHAVAMAQLPDQYELRSGEEDEVILMEKRCRTYRFGKDQAASSTAHTQQQAALSLPPSEPPSEGTILLGNAGGPGAAAAAGGGAAAAAAAAASKEDEKPSEPKEGEDTTGKEKKWHEVGTGPLRILRRTVGDGLRIVQRHESTPNGPATKVIVNLPLWKESVVSQPSEKHVTVSSVCGPETASFLCKFITAEDASEVNDILLREISHAKIVWESTT